MIHFDKNLGNLMETKVKKLEWEQAPENFGSVAITPHYIYVIERLDGIRRFKKPFKVTINTQWSIVTDKRFSNMWQAKDYCKQHWEEFVGGLLE